MRVCKDFACCAALGRCRFVIPAFETRCGGPSYADTLATMLKPDLHEHIARDCLGPMRGKVAQACHGPTDFGKWFNATQPYGIQYATHFEPWFMSDRLTTRWFDARYRGYGKNKIVQVGGAGGAGDAAARRMLHTDRLRPIAGQSCITSTGMHTHAA